MEESLPAVRAKLAASIRRDQSAVYSNVWLAGGGVMTAIAGVALASLALVPGVLVMAVGGAVMLPLGVIRAREGLQRISETTAELERIEPEPLPPARVVT